MRGGGGPRRRRTSPCSCRPPCRRNRRGCPSGEQHLSRGRLPCLVLSPRPCLPCRGPVLSPRSCRGPVLSPRSCLWSLPCRPVSRPHLPSRPSLLHHIWSKNFFPPIRPLCWSPTRRGFSPRPPAPHSLPTPRPPPGSRPPRPECAARPPACSCKNHRNKRRNPTRPSFWPPCTTLDSRCSRRSAAACRKSPAETTSSSGTRRDLGSRSGKK